MESRKEIEESILSAMLMDKDTVDYIITESNEGLFKYYNDVYSIFKSNYDKDMRVDVVVLNSEGISKEKIKNIVQSSHTSIYANTHLSKLKEMDFEDRSTKYAKDILSASGAKKKLEVMSELPTYDAEAVTHMNTRDMTQEVLNKIAQRAKSKDDIKGNRTYFSKLDRITSGMFKGGVVVIEGDTNIGKSLFVEKLALNIAKHGKRADYFAYEMSNSQCIERMMAMSAGIPIDAVNNPKNNWTKQQTQDMNAFYNSSEIQNVHFFSDELHEFTLEELKTKSNKITAKTRQKPTVIIVDYVELMTGKGENDTEIVKNNFEGLMRYAKKLKDTTIVMIMSRNKNGQMSGSNKLAYHAHLHIRLEVSTDIPGIIEAEIKKNRDGGKGVIEFVFVPKYLKFEERMDI